LLHLLSHTIAAVYSRSDPAHLSTDHLKTLRTLEIRLETLTQTPRVTVTSIPTPSSPSSPTTVQTQSAEADLAELYRLATLIYLQRMAWARPRAAVADILDKAMKLLRRMQVVERPWPLFVIALEARDEGERRLLVDVLGKSAARRPLGNVPKARNAILAAWVQMDLHGGAGGEGQGAGGREVDPMVIYAAVLGGGRVPGGFT
jgi:hypothetical protein